VGRADEARTVLEAWWDSAWSSAGRQDRQRALWLRGRLTPDPTRAALDFRRLVVEYPGGPFTDRALFRLAQEAFVSGDTAGARQRVADLARNYPGSSVRGRAEAWLQGAGQAPPPLPPAVADSAEAADSARAVRAAAAAAAKRALAAKRAAAQSVGRGDYAVQLGAFGDVERARLLANRARKAGLEVRIVRVRGSRLVRVRTGRFDSADSAHNLLTRVGRLGFGAAVVGNAQKEERVR
jgi:hypothetical protein